MSTRIASRSRPDSGRNGAGFLREEAGVYTVFAVIAFAMLMVVIGLIIDVGRVMNVHSQASSYADRIALAAAGELDGRPGALDRAVAAAQAIPAGSRLTLTGDDQVRFSRFVFMSTLGADPADPYARSPIGGDVVTKEWRNGNFRPGGISRTRADRESRYVMVETTPERENYLFSNLAGGLMPDVAQSATVTPQAVAGFKRELCNSAPIMVCNPSENIQIGASFNPNTNQQINFNLQASLWGARNYSLLDVDANVLGIPLSINLRNLLNRQDPGTACYGGQVRVERSLGLSLSLRTDIRNGLNDRYNANLRQFPVAIVNCREHALQLLLGLDVPVEAYAQVRMTNNINNNDVNVRLRLQFLGTVSSGLPQENLREYPVLAR